MTITMTKQTIKVLTILDAMKDGITPWSRLGCDHRNNVTGVDRWLREVKEIDRGDKGITKTPDYALARSIVNAVKPWVKWTTETPIYIRYDGKDFIRMPEERDYPNLDHYWWEHFHELAHWVHYGRGRLSADQDDMKEHGEMIADMSAAILIDYCGIPYPRRKNSGYLPLWVAEMEADPDYFVVAADFAERVVKYLFERI